MSKKKLILVIIVLGFFVRIINLNFPFFNADEARIGFRAYSLTGNGTDELGRKFPLIFNSLEDYQLPLTSYVVAAGVKVFGKNDLGVRLPFIIIGALLIWLTYLIASAFNPSEKFKLMAALLTAFSPALIFLSKVPNEVILLTFLLASLFYLLNREKINIFYTLSVFLPLLLTSKIAWFVLFPFTFFTLFIFRQNMSLKSKAVIAISLLLSVFSFLIFLKIPQAHRSLMENNFSLLRDVTIENGINRLRGQGIMSGLPSLLEKILFNKVHFILVGFLNWLSSISLATFFAQFDSSGMSGFLGLGAWSKVLIIPLFFALGNLIGKNYKQSFSSNKNLIYLAGFLTILTFPAFFVFPVKSANIVVLVLPFMAVLLAFGLLKMNWALANLLLILMFLEVVANILFISPQIKNTNSLRPGWVKEMVLDGYTFSKKYNVVFSDDITEGLDAFINWYAPVKSSGDSRITFPYKFNQYKFSGFSLIGNESKFYNCGFDKPAVIFASRRDLSKIQKVFSVSVDRIYKDNLDNNVVYQLHPGVCIHES